jgi:exodeoxyribonuclease VII large subunit
LDISLDLFDYIEEPEQHTEAPPLSVTELSNQLRATVEETFYSVAITGEISNFHPAASGHIYFKMKDAQNAINAIIWRGTAERLAFRPEEGMQVVARGKITTYGARSEYQIIINTIEPAGQGALMQILEERKKKLEAEGLFNTEHKKPIPYLPAKIGIVTSSTGAVIQDMLHRIEERCPRHILLWPTAVQGKGAENQIAQAIKGFNTLDEDKKPDVIIVARGGGSLEDLWAFNEEIVVRAIFESDIPVISGVGHEPDVTLCDYVADKRAPTPSAAAEMAVPVKSELIYALNNTQSRMLNIIQNQLVNYNEKVRLLANSIPNPQSKLIQANLRLGDYHERLIKTMQHTLQLNRQRIKNAEGMLASYAPDAPLKRGYVYATSADGSLINSAKKVAKGTKLTLHFKDGEKRAEIIN